MQPSLHCRGQRPIPPGVPLARGKLAEPVGQVVAEDRSQPCRRLGATARPRSPRQLLVSLEERLLDDPGQIHPVVQSRRHLEPGQQARGRPRNRSRSSGVRCSLVEFIASEGKDIAIAPAAEASRKADSARNATHSVYSERHPAPLPPTSPGRRCREASFLSPFPFSLLPFKPSPPERVPEAADEGRRRVPWPAVKARPFGPQP